MNIFAWLFGRKRSATHPDGVKVSPEGYRSAVRDEFWHAVAQLETQGIDGRRHNIEKVDIRPGTTLRPGGWSLPCNSSPTGWAGGWRESRRLVVVANPNTGAIPKGYMSHEWAHAIMDMNGGPYGVDEQHLTMRKCGLM